MRVFVGLLSFLMIGAEARTLKPGEWGGQHVRLVVQADAAALEFDCARGTIPGKIALRANGAFEMRGRYRREHGGPVRKGEESAGVPVTYRGRLTDATLTLEVIAEDGTTLGAFELSRGAPGRLVKCR